MNPNGRKYWRYKYRFDGKEKIMALRVYPETTLPKATAAHQVARDMLASGRDPMIEKKMQERADRQAQETSFNWRANAAGCAGRYPKDGSQGAR